MSASDHSDFERGLRLAKVAFSIEKVETRSVSGECVMEPLTKYTNEMSVWLGSELGGVLSRKTCVTSALSLHVAELNIIARSYARTQQGRRFVSVSCT